MSRGVRLAARLASLGALATALAACGAGKSAPPASAPAPASQPSHAEAYEPAGAAPPPADSRSTSDAPSAVAESSSVRPPAAVQPSGGFATPPPQGRAIAVQSAANEVESSQRELDVAAGDCRNACRALGSMDRATGRLCGLAQGEVESRRCQDAKTRVYSARDRVKATCGTCEGGPSVERAAPIPSLR